jgi:hypothetical protein
VAGGGLHDLRAARQRCLHGSGQRMPRPGKLHHPLLHTALQLLHQRVMGAQLLLRRLLLGRVSRASLRRLRAQA